MAAPQQRHNLGKRRLVLYTEFISQSDIMKISHKGQRQTCMKSHRKAEDVVYNAGLTLAVSEPQSEQVAHAKNARSGAVLPPAQSLEGCHLTYNPDPGSVLSSPKDKN